MNPAASVQPVTPRSVVLFQQAELVRAPRVSAFHRHDFWQMEWSRQGSWELQTSEAVRSIVAGDVAFFPPGTGHGFTYAGRGESFLSVKFHAEGAPGLPDRVLFAPKSAFLKHWQACLHELLAISAAPVCNLSLAALIDSLLIQLLPRVTDVTPAPACVRRAQAFIESSAGRPITVEETARAAGVAPGYLATVFRVATGQTVKQAIDRQRIQLARAILHYADLSIGETAHRIGFPDIYAFSRFFKRHTGQSPQSFRQSSLLKSTARPSE
jgi:AraC-like DNA-binding protein